MNENPYAVLIEEGEYEAVYVREDQGVAYGQPRIFVTFRVTTAGSAFGRCILRFYNKPKGRRLARSHNMALDFMNVTGRRPPTRGLLPKKFLQNCEVLVKVCTVRQRLQDGKRIDLPPDCHYSKVDRVIRLTAGTPPVLAR